MTYLGFDRLGNRSSSHDLTRLHCDNASSSIHLRNICTFLITVSPSVKSYSTLAVAITVSANARPSKFDRYDRRDKNRK